MNTPSTPLTYESAGVNIEAGDALVEAIKPIAKRTHSAQVMGGLGGFGALFELPSGYKNPVLVSSTDGVGTKLALAQTLHQHNTIGIDLVAMCVNDILVMGAKPLFFLDYYATGALSVETAAEVIQGIAKGCELSNMALIGGETAEMPGFYQKAEYDLAGFCVGVVEKNEILDGSRVKVGDHLIAISSSGVHSNGYSLVRKIMDVTQTAYDAPFGESTFGDVLLTPTKIYAKVLTALFEHQLINAAAHITGGGITENLPRVLSQHTCAQIDLSAWKWPSIFQWLQTQGKISEAEMLRTFNCGVGMILCISPDNVPQVKEILQAHHETPIDLGIIGESDHALPYVSYIKKS